MMSSLGNKNFMLFAGVGVAAVTVISGYLVYKQISKNFIPKRWKRVGQITEILCYPIKSCGAIRLGEVDCTILGVQSGNMRDRVFMITKSDGEFTTARTYPHLVNIKPKIEGDILTLSANGMMDITINFKELYKMQTKKSRVWGEEVISVDCGENIAKWISRFILSEDTGLRMVFFPSKLPTRNVREKNKDFDFMLKKDTGALHDTSSYMLINENSINDLNTRVEEKVNAQRFRPNFVITGPQAYDEDNWKWIRIGKVVFRNVKPCTRCIFTNIDPDTGKRNPNREPLKTLKSYRMFPDISGDSPVMGINLGLRRKGVVSLGDSVYVPI